MNWQDYMTIGVVILNLIAAVRHHKFTLAAFQKGLANNRQLLARTLTDIAKAVDRETPVNISAPVEEAHVVEDPNKVAENV